MKHYFACILLFIFLLSLPTQAEMKKLGQAGMTFLNIGGSARAAGMAEVFGFAQGDLASIFYNPAGLATVEKRSFFFNMTNWLVDMKVSHLAVSWNLEKYGTFAINAQMMDYGDIPGTVISETNPQGYEDTGNIEDVAGLALGLSYGIQMTDKFSIGGTAKWINQKLGHTDTYTAAILDEQGKLNKVNSVAFDFGTMYDTGIRSLVLTMSIRNYSGQLLYENEEFQIPQTYKIGLAANLFELLPLSPGATHKAILAVEGIDPRDRKEYVNVGLEYTVSDLVSFRGGWATQNAQDNDAGLALGAGLKLNLGGIGGRFDMAYTDYGDILGSVLRFSISGTF